MSGCATPLSWLVLERYHLGDLPPSEHDSVAHHLRGCEECKGTLARIAEDDARPLPPLAIAASVPARRVATPKLVRATGLVAGLALAAAVVLAIGRRTTDDELAVRAKGEGVSFALVREDEALIAEAGGAYRDGERFKALVTCPPSMHGSFDVAVYDELGAVTFPLPPNARVTCGNSVALPGAFRVTGNGRMVVCLGWRADGAIDRDALRRPPLPSVPGSLCKTLDPIP